MTYKQRLQHRLVGPQYARAESWPYGRDYAVARLHEVQQLQVPWMATLEGHLRRVMPLQAH